MKFAFHLPLVQLPTCSSHSKSHPPILLNQSVDFTHISMVVTRRQLCSLVILTRTCNLRRFDTRQMPEFRSLSKESHLFPQCTWRLWVIQVFWYTLVPNAPPILKACVHRCHGRFKDERVFKVKHQRVNGWSNVTACREERIRLTYLERS